VRREWLKKEKDIKVAAEGSLEWEYQLGDGFAACGLALRIHSQVRESVCVRERARECVCERESERGKRQRERVCVRDFFGLGDGLAAYGLALRINS